MCDIDAADMSGHTHTHRTTTITLNNLCAYEQGLIISFSIIIIIMNWIHYEREMRFSPTHENSDLNRKKDKATNPNNFFSLKRKKSCSGGIRTHDTLLARQML